MAQSKPFDQFIAELRATPPEPTWLDHTPFSPFLSALKCNRGVCMSFLLKSFVIAFVHVLLSMLSVADLWALVVMLFPHLY